MKLENNSVVGLLTNLRWDWLNLIFVKSDFHEERGRGGKAKSDF